MFEFDHFRGLRLKIDDHFKWFGCCENLKDLLQKLSSELIISNFIALKPTIRSSRLEVLYKKRVLKNFAKFTGKHLCQSLPEAEACNFIKKRDSETGVFLWILQNFWEHLFLQNTSGDCFCTSPQKHPQIDFNTENSLKKTNLGLIIRLLKYFTYTTFSAKLTFSATLSQVKQWKYCYKKIRRNTNLCSHLQQVSNVDHRRKK